jgi:HrpA-like RNA helicase
MLASIHDRFLPPDHNAFVSAEPPTGRVIVIAPTRAACETIEIALTIHIETYLEKSHGVRVRELARSGKGFGIIAGTGTGKTLAIRPIAEEILRAPLQIGVVNREREATPELPNLNVIIVTTGIARRWFQDGDILPGDTLIVDEIHQTSAELELCLALGKRARCRFIWLSATVDPSFYRRYLNSADVLEVFSFDPEKAADVTVTNEKPLDFLDNKFLKKVLHEKRGVGVFLPTRAGVEDAALGVLRRFPKLNAAFYHGGEPVSAIRPFLEDEGAPKPFLLAMTAAGQSALNVRGLDTVVIEDARFSNVIQSGRNVLTRAPLGNNEILQMAGRVHGRVAGGRVFILSERDIDFYALRPTAPEFQLAGDSERVALTCAELGAVADELELPVPLDRVAYKNAFAMLQQRGIINAKGRLTTYGKAVEVLPVDRPWAELIAHADRALLPFLAVMSSIESLHRMTRDERDLRGLFVAGSDHLTSYNLYAEAFQVAGEIGEIHGLPRHVFDSEKLEKWAEARGVLIKTIEDAALAMACVFRSVEIPLPREMPLATPGVLQSFTELLAKLMPFDLVIDEQTSDGRPAFVSRSSLCQSDGAIAGTLRYFADKRGGWRAAIEGTQIPMETIRRHAQRAGWEYSYHQWQPQAPLILHRTTHYFGFVLERKSEAVKTFPSQSAGEARQTLARAAAQGIAQHPAVSKNRDAIEEVRELHRRAPHEIPALDEVELTEIYRQQLDAQNVDSLAAFRKAHLSIRVEDFAPWELREQLWDLPADVEIDGQEIPIKYEVEKSGARFISVARLQLPEKLARALSESDLPQLDRPLRLIVSRGSRGAVVAATIEELQDKLEGRWTPDEVPQTAKAKPKATENPERKPRHAPPGPRRGNKGGRPKKFANKKGRGGKTR